MASKNAKKGAEFSEGDSSENEDENLILGNDNTVEGYQAVINNQAQQKANTQAAHNVIHLHFQKRNARQCLTAVRGLPDDLDMKKLTRHFKKAWCCNGTTAKHSEWGDIIQLQGDHRRDIYKFLIDEGIAVKEDIKIHGY